MQLSPSQCEKEITLWDLSGNFLRNFDTGSNMDPFLEVTFAKVTHQTEVNKNGGKEPEWKTTMKFNFLYQTQISFQAYDKDDDRDQDIGSGTLSIADLKYGKGGVKLFLKGTVIGEIHFKYDIKKLSTKRNLQLENIKLEMFQAREGTQNKQASLLAVVEGQESIMNPAIIHERHVVWNDYLRIKFLESQNQFDLKVLLDGKQVAQERCFLRQLDFAHGTKQYYLIDEQALEPFGLLSFMYRSINVSYKGGENSNSTKTDSMDKIRVSKICISDAEPNRKNVQVRIIIGSNFVDTEAINQNPTSPSPILFNSVIQLYREHRQKKITFLFFESRLTQNKLLSRCHILIQNLQEQKQSKDFLDSNRKPNAKLSFQIEKQTVPASFVTFSQIQLKLLNRCYQIHPYIRANIASSVDKTQTVQLGKKTTFIFKKPLHFLFYNETEVEFCAHDEDINTYMLIGTGSIAISSLKQQSLSGPVTITIRNRQDKEVGSLSFEHNLKLSNEYMKMRAEIDAPEDTAAEFMTAVPTLTAQRKSIPKSEIRQQPQQQPYQDFKPKDNKLKQISRSKSKDQREY